MRSSVEMPREPRRVARDVQSLSWKICELGGRNLVNGGWGCWETYHFLDLRLHDRFDESGDFG